MYGLMLERPKELESLHAKRKKDWESLGDSEVMWDKFPCIYSCKPPFQIIYGNI